MRLLRRHVSIAVCLAFGLTVAAVCAAPGDLDLSFQGTGWMHTPAGPNGGMGMALQPDGKIVVVGRAFPAEPGFPARLAVWRFNPDGSSDTSFKGTGRALMPTTGPVDTGGTRVTVRDDGLIIAAGWWAAQGGNQIPGYLLAFFKPDGQPDFSLSPVGFNQTGLQGTPYALTIQPDGKILMAGGSPSSFKLTRWTLNGTLDPSFGSSGVAELPLSGTNGVYGAALALQSDGKILAARDNYAFTVLRLLPNGSLDPGFGTGGAVSIYPQGPTQASCLAMAVMPDGKILAGGPDYGDNTHGHGFMIVRFLPDGTPDPSFGETGTPGRSYIPANNSYFVFSGMSVQSDGGILMSASVGDPLAQASRDIMLGRFTAAGLPDLSFGTAGRVRTDLGNTRDECRASALLTDQKLVIAGTWGLPGPDTSEDILLARYEVPAPVGVSIEYPPGTALLPWSGPVDFGPVTAGIGIVQLALKNTGLVPLTNLQAVLTDESIPGDYHVSPPAAVTLAPGGQTTVIVSLTPSAAPGVRTAGLRLTADNSGLPLTPRVIPLTGSKATPLQIWRVTWFGSPHNSGVGADLNDFDGDGLPNFMEYATRSHPHQYTSDPSQPAGPGIFTYTRPSAALPEFSYQPESAPSPAGPWSSAGLSSTILTDDGTVQTVKVTPAAEASAARLFLRLRVTKL